MDLGHDEIEPPASREHCMEQIHTIIWSRGEASVASAAKPAKPPFNVSPCSCGVSDSIPNGCLSRGGHGRGGDSVSKEGARIEVEEGSSKSSNSSSNGSGGSM